MCDIDQVTSKISVWIFKWCQVGLHKQKLQLCVNLKCNHSKAESSERSFLFRWKSWIYFVWVKVGRKHPTNVNSICCRTCVLRRHNGIRGHPSRTSNVYEWPNQSMLNLPQHRCQHVQHTPRYEDSFTFVLARPLTRCSLTLFTFLLWTL